MESMNPLAIELNRQIKRISPSAFECLSEIGKHMYFPLGILSQSADARERAHKYNATIGIALERHRPMHLNVTKKFFRNLSPEEIYTYAPPEGLPELRRLWKEKLYRTNPSLTGKSISNPIVTSALTHGLCVVADLFVDRGDTIVAPDKMWGVYGLNFTTRKGARIVTFPMFNADGRFNLTDFARLLEAESGKNDKLISILSFPNNPTGYTPTVAEARELYRIVKEQAGKGTKIVTLSDDAYFGLFYEDSVKESLFSGFCDLHENVLAIKLDGATKESFAWGFRTGFVTFGTKSNDSQMLYRALETKLKGLIRSTISSSNHPSQTIVEKILKDPEYDANLAEKFHILKRRALKLKQVLSQEKFKSAWDYYPFNSGYFMSLKLHQVDAEVLRNHLLDQYGIGTVSMDSTDLRIAFSCIEEEEIEDLVERIYRAVNELS